MAQTATITSIKREFNLSPNIVGIITTADLGTITTADYFTNESDNVSLLNNGVWQWEPGDIIVIYYATNLLGWFSYDDTTGAFVSLSGGGSSVTPSNPGLPIVASVLNSGTLTVSNIATYQDADGTIGDSSVSIFDVQLLANIKAYVTADIGGGGAGPITVADASLTGNSVVIGTIYSSSNAVTIDKITSTSGGFNITFSGDPGAVCRVNIVAFVVSQ